MMNNFMNDEYLSTYTVHVSLYPSI